MTCLEYLQSVTSAAYALVPIYLGFMALFVFITYRMYRWVKTYEGGDDGQFGIGVGCALAGATALILFANALDNVHTGAYPEGDNQAIHYCAPNPPVVYVRD